METYHEKYLVINGRELKYKGIFKVDELFAVINKSLERKGYEKREKKTEELVTEAGRRTQVELRPFKMKSSFVSLMIKMRITLDNVTETVMEKEGIKNKFQLGDVMIVFDSWVLTEYQNRWNMKPLIYFIKGVFNKYVWTMPLEGSVRREVAIDTAYVYAQIKHLLVSYKGGSKEREREEDIIKEMEKEMAREIEEEGKE
ncbi:hypothetical protein HYX11_02350 [Candidatus Woesearchaeota archaeon]|nr:hypothetical protein [Candidatus Woesearchaeota archaeon]